MRRRLDLAASLVGRPEVIFLDEPTTGLDPRSRQAMWDVVGELVGAGVTVFLTTQYLEEADRLADRIAVIDGGRVVAEGTAAELKRRVAEQRLDLVLADAEAFAAAERMLGDRDAAPRPGRPHARRRDRRQRRRTCARCSTRSIPTAARSRASPSTARRSTTSSSPSPATRPRRPTMPWRPAVSDALTMSARSVRLSMRHLDALLTSLLLPVMLMLMFVELFGGAIETGTKDYVTYVVPGVILLCAGFGSATTAVSVSQDMTGGIIDRFRSMDVGGAGRARPATSRRASRATSRRPCSCIGVALALGFRPVADVARLARGRRDPARVRRRGVVAGGRDRPASRARPRRRTGSRSS